MGLGAGLSFMGETCGLVSGYAIACGLDIACYTRETALIRVRATKATRKFCLSFIEKFGSVRCKDLVGINFLEPDAVEKYLNGSPPLCEKCLYEFQPFTLRFPLPSEQGEPKI